MDGRRESQDGERRLERKTREEDERGVENMRKGGRSDDSNDKREKRRRGGWKK